VAGASGSSFQYTYTPNSNLISTVTNRWDPSRDALLEKDNRLDGATEPVSNYVYAMNPLGMSLRQGPLSKWSARLRGSTTSMAKS